MESGRRRPRPGVGRRPHRLGRSRRQGGGDRVRRSRNRRLQPAAHQAGALHVYRDVKEVLDQLYTSPLASLLT